MYSKVMALIKRKLEIAKVWGVPVYLDWSLLIFAAIYVFRSGLILGLTAAILLMLSVLLHELGHTAVALSYGCRVRDITLLLLGGRATLIDIPRKPWKEAWMAAAGPLVSLALGVAGFLLLPIMPQGLPQYTMWYLSYINFGLLVFNLIPAFPMDGGRIFRALLSSKLGRRRATFIAYRVAQVLAACMAVWALFRGFDFVLILIAYFVFTSAKAEYAMVLAEGECGGFDPRNGDSVIISPPPYGRRKDVTDIYKE